MSETPEEENSFHLLYVQQLVEKARVAAKKAWEEARLMNEEAGQRSETWRELTSRTSAALDALEKGVKYAKKEFENLMAGMDEELNRRIAEAKAKK